MSDRGGARSLPVQPRGKGRWAKKTVIWPSCLGPFAALVALAAPAAAGPPAGQYAAPNQANGFATSGNWSGYVATGTSYTEASGTFSVPGVSRYLAGSTASEWVGVDGWSDSSLIQAGVNEVPVGRGSTLFEPWWEIVPGPQHLAPGMMVRPGDRVTVKVAEATPGSWSISLVDDTDGDSFSTVQPYGGPATSAEWVVEADATAAGAPTKLAPLAGKVTFSAAALDNAPVAPGGSLESGTELGSAPPSTEASPAGATTFTKVVMVQGGNTVSAPSLLAGGTFTVASS